MGDAPASLGLPKFARKPPGARGGAWDRFLLAASEETSSVGPSPQTSGLQTLRHSICSGLLQPPQETNTLCTVDYRTMRTPS